MKAPVTDKQGKPPQPSDEDRSCWLFYQIFLVFNVLYYVYRIVDYFEWIAFLSSSMGLQTNEKAYFGLIHLVLNLTVVFRCFFKRNTYAVPLFGVVLLMELLLYWLLAGQWTMFYSSFETTLGIPVLLFYVCDLRSNRSSKQDP